MYKTPHYLAIAATGRHVAILKTAAEEEIKEYRAPNEQEEGYQPPAHLANIAHQAQPHHSTRQKSQERQNKKRSPAKASVDKIIGNHSATFARRVAGRLASSHRLHNSLVTTAGPQERYHGKSKEYRKCNANQAKRKAHGRVGEEELRSHHHQLQLEEQAFTFFLFCHIFCRVSA